MDTTNPMATCAASLELSSNQENNLACALLQAKSLLMQCHTKVFFQARAGSTPATHQKTWLLMKCPCLSFPTCTRCHRCWSLSMAQDPLAKSHCRSLWQQHSTQNTPARHGMSKQGLPKAHRHHKARTSNCSLVGNLHQKASVCITIEPQSSLC